MIRAVASALFWGACAYGAVVLLLYLNQSRYVYLPIEEHATTPAAYRMAYEDFWITTEDGVRLHGWHVPAPQPRAALLFFHGNAGNISHRLDSIRIFHELGLSVFIFDYRGYGRSEGSPSEEGTYRDALAAWRNLREERGLPAHAIVVFGRSLGASIAAWLAARERPAALIIESAFTSAPDLGAEIYPWLPVRWLLRIRYDTLAAVRETRVPILVVHSREDRIVPFHHGESLFAAANAPKNFLELRGGHNDGFLVSRPDYVAGLRRFLAAQPGLLTEE